MPNTINYKYWNYQMTIKSTIKVMAFTVLVGTSLASAPLSAEETAKPASLYDRLGGYDAISAVTEDLVSRLAADKQLGRFWAHRGADGIAREIQLVKSFIVEAAGGPLHYPGRANKVSHKGMRISEKDWSTMMRHLDATLDKFKLAERERKDVIGFIESTKKDIVELP